MGHFSSGLPVAYKRKHSEHCHRLKFRPTGLQLTSRVTTSLPWAYRSTDWQLSPDISNEEARVFRITRTSPKSDVVRGERRREADSWFNSKCLQHRFRDRPVVRVGGKRCREADSWSSTRPSATAFGPEVSGERRREANSPERSSPRVRPEVSGERRREAMPHPAVSPSATAYGLELDGAAAITLLDDRQFLEVSDFVDVFARCASQKTHGHARIARVLRAILACPCVF